jgi:pimeloyl-ACP methyl ester carboxylesterase
MMSRILRLSDGLAARVIEAGRGAPVLLIHGVGMRAEAWAPQMASLAGEFRMIAVDMPGHGESEPLLGDPRLPDYVSWAARVIEALDVAPVAVAGHSMGSLIAAGLAVEHPDLVCRAAVLNGVHRRTPEARAAVLARAAEIAAGRAGIDGPLARWFGPDECAQRDLVASWLGTVPQAGYAAAYRAFAEGDGVYADRLAEIRCPVLVLTGDGDANSTPDMTRTMAAMAPLGQAVIIPGHRHMVNLTAPEAVSGAMRAWLLSEKAAA